MTALLAASTLITAQTPNGINYQAVVRNSTGQTLSNQSVGIQMTILKGDLPGTIVYQETFNVETNNYGLTNFVIGTGDVVTGTFSTIDWGKGPYFIETAMDIDGGSSYVEWVQVNL